MNIPGHTESPAPSCGKGGRGKGRRGKGRRGEGPWAWLSAAAVALSLLMLGALLVLLASRGLGHFWPASLEQVTLDDGQEVIGVAVETRALENQAANETRFLTANRDFGGGVWTWVASSAIVATATPGELVALERRRWGSFFGRLVAVRGDGRRHVGDDAWQTLTTRLAEIDRLRERRDEISQMRILPLVRQMESSSDAAANHAAQHTALAQAQAEVRRLQAAMTGTTLILESAQGRRIEQPLDEVLRAWRPNAMAWYAKLGHWGSGVWHFLSEGPRDANTAGGVWPAIFGTILMVMLMSLLVTPFGVLAAVYLNEVAHQGRLTHLVRIAVRNLAGVPSIVYGVFGLGVFVYGIGGSIDRLFYADTLPSPTFGTGGLLWASLTLALLTLPVVIVATEEGLARIPAHQREGALALGATRFETLTRVVLPMATPAMLTGVILAVARAAGEVAPLMLVGVAKLAPQVPLDGEFPYLHVERKFMHLGYHIYDAAFHASDVQAALPLVYATALLLVLVILVLNLTAIFLRHHLRTRHGAYARP
ncbi:phosphate ABC transporter permease PstA [Halomonas sp. V046]|uniref:phosphate ABC transporter permease PstA n=1 Tax=Halomonas sp. V046 TaxID=3459611 RepID=UPI004044BCD5